MSRGLRAALAAVAALGALAFAGSALAGNTGSVAVSHEGAATTIHISIPRETNPIAAITIYVPSSYDVTLGQAAGTTIGKIPAAAVFSYDTNLTLPLTGAVVVADPASIPAATVQACIGAATPQAVWMLNLELSGQSLAVPMFVSATAGSEQARGSAKITTCLPPPDVPQDFVGRAAFGAQLLDAEFTVNGIFAKPAGSVVWETLMTPYTPGAGTVNLAGTFETRALIAPATASLKAKVNRKKHIVTLTGAVAGGGVPLGGSVVVFRGSKPKKLSAAGAANAKAGKFASRAKAKGKKPVYFQVRVTGAETDVTAAGCQQPLPAEIAPGGCVSATLAPFTATSRVVRVKP